MVYVSTACHEINGVVAEKISTCNYSNKIIELLCVDDITILEENQKRNVHLIGLAVSRIVLYLQTYIYTAALLYSVIGLADVLEISLYMYKVIQYKSCN